MERMLPPYLSPETSLRCIRRSSASTSVRPFSLASARSIGRASRASLLWFMNSIAASGPRKAMAIRVASNWRLARSGERGGELVRRLMTRTAANKPGSTQRSSGLERETQTIAKRRPLRSHLGFYGPALQHRALNALALCARRSRQCTRQMGHWFYYVRRPDGLALRNETMVSHGRLLSVSGSTRGLSVAPAYNEQRAVR